MIWHSTDRAAVLKELEVDDKKGLPNGVADMRLEKYGKNIISDSGKPTYLKLFLSQLNSKLVLVLIITALLSFIVSLMYNEVNSFSPEDRAAEALQRCRAARRPPSTAERSPALFPR